MDRIPMPSALLSCLLLFPLRGQESRQKQVVIGHRGRSRRNMGLPAYGTRHPSATIRATEHNVRSKHQQTPLHYRVKTKSPGTDGMIISRGSFCATADSPEPGFLMISALRLPRFDAATPPEAVFHAIPDHEGKMANRAVQLIAGRHHFRAKPTVTRRSGTGDADRRASRVPSLPPSAIHPHRQPAIPDGGRSQTK